MKTMRQRRITDSPGSYVLFLLVIRKPNEDVFLNGVRTGKRCFSKHAAIESSLSVIGVAVVVSGDNDSY